MKPTCKGCYEELRSRAYPVSTFDASEHEARDEVFLHERVDDQNRKHAQYHDCHLQVVVDILTTAERLVGFEHQRAQDHLQGVLAAVVDEHDNLEIPVPVTYKVKQRNSGNDGDRKRQDDFQQDGNVVAAVEGGALNERDRDAGHIVLDDDQIERRDGHRKYDRPHAVDEPKRPYNDVEGHNARIEDHREHNRLHDD